MKYADIIIPHGRSNTVAIEFVLNNLKNTISMKDIDEVASTRRSEGLLEVEEEPPEEKS